MKIAIVGGSPVSRHLAPFDDKEWQIWGLGNQIDFYDDKRINLIFEIHENLEEHEDPQKYMEYLARQGIPLVVSNNCSDFGEVFPYEEANKLLDGEYLTSSPAYMMAYAILKGATDIGIYGVEMALDDHEYFKQRTAMYAWIGYAKGLGIKIHIPDESSLFKEPYCEGRDWNNIRVDGTFTSDAFQVMMQRHSDKIDELKGLIKAHEGSVAVYKALKQVARANESGAKQVDLLRSLKVK